MDIARPTQFGERAGGHRDLRGAGLRAEQDDGVGREGFGEPRGIGAVRDGDDDGDAGEALADRPDGRIRRCAPSDHHVRRALHGSLDRFVRSERFRHHFARRFEQLRQVCRERRSLPE